MPAPAIAADSHQLPSQALLPVEGGPLPLPCTAEGTKAGVS